MLAPVSELVEHNSCVLTREIFESALPKGLKIGVSDEFLDRINDILTKGSEKEAFKENLISFTRVLMEGKYTLEQYANAVRYVGFKLSNHTNLLAWVKTFPVRYQEMLDTGWTEKDINSRVSAYHRTQLVTKILEASLIPSWIVNQDLYQKALNTQAELMVTARSEKVRSEAANSLLTHLKMPETAKVELDVNMKEDDSIADLRKTTLELVKQQRAMLEAGAMRAVDVARQKIVPGEVVSEQ